MKLRIFRFKLLFLLLYIPSPYHEDDVLKWRYFKRSFPSNYTSRKASEPSHKNFQRFFIAKFFAAYIF